MANPWVLFIGLAIVLYTMFGWWSDTVKEAHEGHHTRVVSLHLRYGMIMFIASEVMFFVAWFWAFFDASLFPGEAIQATRTAFTGGVWLPKGIEVLDPWHLPLYNTVILLLSGTCVTWAHHALLHGDRKGLINGLTLTVLLGMLFLRAGLRIRPCFHCFCWARPGTDHFAMNTPRATPAARSRKARQRRKAPRSHPGGTAGGKTPCQMKPPWQRCCCKPIPCGTTRALPTPA